MRQKLPKILVTGGAGFIGSEFVRQGVRRGYPLVVVDKLTYAGDRRRLLGVRGGYRLYRADICRPASLESVFRAERPPIVVHFAAESHVDRSIQRATPFTMTNVLGTQITLDLARQYRVERFIHISTDEVYGPIARGRFSEGSPLSPSSPYAASKAAADLLVKAYARTFGLPALIVRPSNNFGPWQHPEKLIPVVVLKALRRESVPVYAKGENKREWLYVSDCVAAVFAVLAKGTPGEVYNVGSGQEQRNIDTVRQILKLLGRPPRLIRYVQDRPGHDYRYSLDSSKVRRLGWRPEVDFAEGLEETVRWCLGHRRWLDGKRAELKALWRKVYKS